MEAKEEVAKNGGKIMYLTSLQHRDFCRDDFRGNLNRKPGRVKTKERAYNKSFIEVLIKYSS